VKSSLSFTLGANFEYLQLTGAGAINGTGNDLGNMITGNAAANTLSGLDGDDLLNGGSGADKMYGGLGNDVYVVDDIGDRVTEGSQAGGNDVVQSSISYILTPNIENLILAAGAEIDGTGNGLANLITGNDSANVLSGASGADVLNAGGGDDALFGGTGSDLLIGGDGADLFCFDTYLGASINVDQIFDFTVAEDKIQLDNDIFTSVGALGTLGASAFFTGSAAHDATDRIIYDSASGNIYYDADGIGAGAQVLFANVTSGLAMTSNDFMIVS
jgi:Ca2+-binding RTX toxin-like protein